MCASTRFPEAIQLKNIKTKNIVRALVKFLHIFRPPKILFSRIRVQILCQEFFSRSCMSWALLNISHRLTILKVKVPWKDFIRHWKIWSDYCFDSENDWDESIHLLLFAVRESVQESLGFSPFELLFGHTVRGPLKLLQEKFLSNDDSSLNLLQYVSDLKKKKKKKKKRNDCQCQKLVSLLGLIISQHKGKWNVAMMKMQEKENSCLETVY